MKPILFIHGYSAESEKSTFDAVTAIYGDLPRALKKRYGSVKVKEIDVSRYISLEDGVTIDDISRGLNDALNSDEHVHFMKSGFNVIIHSTGGLVIRNWIRKFSPADSPIDHLVHLAPAHFGSGWAHIGKGQLAKWGRKVFDHGSERGVNVLNALELGSMYNTSLQFRFLERPSIDAYGIKEYVMVGTEADSSWFEIPIRYSHEDGSDGVVRVGAANVNFRYLRLGVKKTSESRPWKDAGRELKRHHERKGKRESHYDVKTDKRTPGNIPFAVLGNCAHSGDKMGIVKGKEPRNQLLDLLDRALSDKTKDDWKKSADIFEKATETTYRNAAKEETPSRLKPWEHIWDRRHQYDPHSMVIFRIFDQYGNAVKHFDIYFDSITGQRGKKRPVNRLIEDNHVNGNDPNCIAFYLRTEKFSEKKNRWVDQFEDINSFYLEIHGEEPRTQDVIYLPLRFKIDNRMLDEFIRPHETTLIDVELYRVPSPEVFIIRKARV